MLRKISIILLILFTLGVILSGFLILKKRSDLPRGMPIEPVDGVVVPFGIQEAGLAVPADGGGGPGSPPK